jgi:hypothetical protein
MQMTAWHVLLTAIVFGVAVQAKPSCAEERLPQSGSYEITARLELPHLERWAVDKATIVCLRDFLSNDNLPVPIVSANNPFANCNAANMIMKTSKLEYDIVCPGRGAAKGHAIYILSANTFSGRVAMVLGGKNMTMTEVQQGHRTGECGRDLLGSAARF